MKSRIDSSKHASLSSESPVPAFLVEMEILAIELVKEARVANVQLVWRDTDNWACPTCQLEMFHITIGTKLESRV